MMLTRVQKVLKDGAYFIIYSPFNVDGKYTSTSNKIFDQQLKSQDKAMGLRDVEVIQRVATDDPLLLIERVDDMPAHNKVLVFKKVSV